MNDSDLFEEEEDDELSDDDIALAEYNMNPMYARGFLKRAPDKKILYRNKPTNDFFEYYLACCDDKEFNKLLEHANKLSKVQREMLDKVDQIKKEQKTEEQELVEQTVKKDNKSTISDYIDKNQELIKVASELRNEISTLRREKQDSIELLRFLYELMGDKCEFMRLKEDGTYEIMQVSNKESNIIEHIKEVVGL